MTESEYQAAAHECAEHLRALVVSSGRPVSAVLETVAKDLLTPQPKPNRLKWGKDNMLGEHSATFAKRAYAVEYEAGILTTALISDAGDKSLAKKLLNDKRTPSKWPPGIDIPTKDEWHDRKLTERDGKVGPVKHVILNRDEVALYNAARYREAHPRH